MKNKKEVIDMSKNECPECGGTRLTTDHKRAEIVCMDCGFVLDDIMFDFGPEWRAFDEDQKSKRARTGGPVKFSKIGKGLTTEIDRYDRDIRGGAIQPERKAQLYRLRKWQRRSQMTDSVQRNLSKALPELDLMCSLLNIPENIKEECAMWYRKAVDQGLVKGRSIESVLAAIIYIISRQHHKPKTLKKLKEISFKEEKNIGRSYRFICKKLKLKMPIALAKDYVPEFASELDISGETAAKAIEILDKAREKGTISGKGPIGVAAAAIYLASKITGKKLTKEKITDCTGVVKVTIRNRANEMRDALGIEIEVDSSKKRGLYNKKKVKEEIPEIPEIPFDDFLVKKGLSEATNKLNLSFNEKKDALALLGKILKGIKDGYIERKEPNFYFAVIIYSATKNLDLKERRDRGFSAEKILNKLGLECSDQTIFSHERKVQEAIKTASIFLIFFQIYDMIKRIISLKK